MLTAIGIGLIVAGVAVALFGDKNVSNEQGFTGKMFTWPAGRAKMVKIPMGLMLIYAGARILIH